MLTKTSLCTSCTSSTGAQIFPLPAGGREVLCCHVTPFDLSDSFLKLLGGRCHCAAEEDRLLVTSALGDSGQRPDLLLGGNSGQDQSFPCFPVLVLHCGSGLRWTVFLWPALGSWVLWGQSVVSNEKLNETFAVSLTSTNRREVKTEARVNQPVITLKKMVLCGKHERENRQGAGTEERKTRLVGFWGLLLYFDPFIVYFKFINNGIKKTPTKLS